MTGDQASGSDADDWENVENRFGNVLGESAPVFGRNEAVEQVAQPPQDGNGTVAIRFAGGSNGGFSVFAHAFFPFWLAAALAAART